MEFEIKLSIRKKRGGHCTDISPKKPLPPHIIGKMKDFEFRVFEARRMMQTYNMDKRTLPCSELNIINKDDTIEGEWGEIVSGTYFSMRIEKDSFCIYYAYTNEDGSVIHSTWTEKEEKKP